MAMKNFYEVLGVPTTADGTAIRKAYRRLAMKHHPDRHLGSANDKATAETNFKAIGEAYETLSDPVRRAAYDRSLQPGPTPGFAGSARSGGYGNFDQMFQDLMRGMAEAEKARPRSNPRPATPSKSQEPLGDDIEQDITVSLEDALHGCSKIVKVHAAMRCPRCHGMGTQCARCGGVGQVFEDRRWDVSIPAGTLDGARLRLKGAGHDGPHFSGPGALYITVRWAPHPVWRPDANGHLERDVRLTPEQAREGVVVKLRTIDGHEGTVSVPPASPAGRRLRLPGKGWPLPDGQATDAFLVIRTHPEHDPKTSTVAPDDGAHRRAWDRWTNRWSKP